MQKDLNTGDARLESLADELRSRFGTSGVEIAKAPGELTMVVPSTELLKIARELHDADELDFKQLIDLCGVDYAAYGSSEWETIDASNSGFGRGRAEDLVLSDDPKRFAVVYHLLSLTHNRRLRVRVFAEGAQPMVDSVCGIWNCADWFEREAFDMYGILFRGHKDLRRLLTDYGFVGHPFRKDFPLTGQVEMRYDPELERVVYGPVEIEPRVLVPRVVREDSRYERVKTDESDA